MLHAPALPGSPAFAGNRASLVEAVLRDAETLVAGGVDALILENFHDAPFYPGKVPPETIAEMTVLATAVRARFDTPLGINRSAKRRPGRPLPSPPRPVRSSSG